MTLRLPCEHGRYDQHPMVWPNGELYKTCPGGRQATPEDLIEALGGEKVWWCEAHKSSALWKSEDRCHARHGIGCRMVERILIPALDQEKET